MVEVSKPVTDPSAAKQSSPASLVWSHNDEIHKLAVQPVKALINLVGSKETTHAMLNEIIQQGIRDIMTKQGSSVTPNYAPPAMRI
jgi:hypothetical protein